MKTISLFASLIFGLSALAADLPPEKKSALEKQFAVVKTWAADKSIVAAVKASNTNPEGKDMTQEKWEKLPVLDSLVKGLIKNATGEALKKLKSSAVTEAFVNNSNGTKVGFLAKTTGWSHKGKPKHDDPMNGKEWTGKVEVDESTGKSQIQISVPVLDGAKAIGSLVVGFSVDELK